LSGNGIFRAETKRPKRLRKGQGHRGRDNVSLNNPPIRGLFDGNREISVRKRVRGGPERTRTPGTQFYRTSLCHCPNVASAGASRRRKSSLRRCEPNQHRWRCTVRLDPAIKHRRTAQRHCREKAGNPLRLERLVLSSVSGRQGRSEILPRRLDRRGGASVVRRPPRTERRRSYRVATWWRYRLEYRKRQIGLVHNLTQSQYVTGAPEERRRQSPERSVIPEEFGRPAKHLIPVNDTSLQPGGV
jgi:hypothetical protein